MALVGSGALWAPPPAHQRAVVSTEQRGHAVLADVALRALGRLAERDALVLGRQLVCGVHAARGGPQVSPRGTLRWQVAHARALTRMQRRWHSAARQHLISQSRLAWLRVVATAQPLRRVHRAQRKARKAPMLPRDTQRSHCSSAWTATGQHAHA